MLGPYSADYSNCPESSEWDAMQHWTRSGMGLKGLNAETGVKLDGPANITDIVKGSKCALEVYGLAHEVLHRIMGMDHGDAGRKFTTARHCITALNDEDGNAPAEFAEHVDDMDGGICDDSQSR